MKGQTTLAWGAGGADLSSLQTGAALGSSLACPDAVRASLSPQRLLRSSLSWHVPLGEVHLWSVFDYTDVFIALEKRKFFRIQPGDSRSHTP